MWGHCRDVGTLQGYGDTAGMWGHCRDVGTLQGDGDTARTRGHSISGDTRRGRERGQGQGSEQGSGRQGDVDTATIGWDGSPLPCVVLLPPLGAELWVCTHVCLCVFVPLWWPMGTMGTMGTGK